MNFLRLILVLLCITLQSCEYLFPSLSGDKITVEEANKYINNHQDDPDIVVLDVRTKEEFDKSHLKNAVNLDYKKSTFPADVEKLDKNKTYIIYSGNDGRASNTFELMKELRFEKIHYINGGIDEWKKQNFPLN